MSPDFAPSRDMIHDQKTMYGSWVTNMWRMAELVERLVRWNIHPADLILLDNAAEAASLYGLSVVPAPDSRSKRPLSMMTLRV